MPADSLPAIAQDASLSMRQLMCCGLPAMPVYSTLWGGLRGHGEPFFVWRWMRSRWDYFLNLPDSRATDFICDLDPLQCMCA